LTSKAAINKNARITLKSSKPEVNTNSTSAIDRADCPSAETGVQNGRVEITQKPKDVKIDGVRNLKLRTQIIKEVNKRKSLVERHFPVTMKQLEKKVYQWDEAPKENAEYSSTAIVGLIISVMGLILMLTMNFPFFMGTFGVIISLIGLVDVAKGKKGIGMAVFGLIIGIITIVLFWTSLSGLGLLWFF
jgi:preprotein translocase subunit SecF